VLKINIFYHPKSLYPAVKVRHVITQRTTIAAAKLQFSVVTFEDAVNNSRRTKLVGHVARRGRGEMHVTFWWGTRSLGRFRLRFEDNIKMDHQEVEYELH